MGQFKNERLDLGLGSVKVGVATSDLLAQVNGLGGFLLCLIDQFLNGAGDPIGEFWSGI